MKPVKNKYEKRMLKLENQRRANPCMKANKTNIRARFGADVEGLKWLREYDADISKPVLYLYPSSGLLWYLGSLTFELWIVGDILFFNSKGEMNIHQEKCFSKDMKKTIILEDDILKIKFRNRGLWKKIIIKTKKKRYSFITLPRRVFRFPDYTLTRQEWPYFVRYMKEIMKHRKHR